MDVIKGNSTVPASIPIQIRHLFTMTSGLDYNVDSEPLVKLFNDKPAYSTRDFVKAVAKSPLRFEPGSHWMYGLNHDVLAALIKVISGISFGEYVRKNIFEPLGMTETWFHLPKDKMNRIANIYRLDRGKAASQLMEYKNKLQKSPNHESGGAGISTTVNEYEKFALAMCNGGKSYDRVRILSRNTVGNDERKPISRSSVCRFHRYER